MIWNVILWIVGVSLLLLGIFTVIVAYRKDLISKLRWDLSMVELGAAILSIGFFFLDKVVSK